MHGSQLYTLTISLILFFTIGFQHKINAKPIEDLIETTTTTSLAPTTTTNETKLIYSGLPSHFYVRPFLMLLPFPFPEPLPNSL
ncbi:unnamed protein product [Rotaria sordida]|uniref:Transmembrane protein n=1 Tax=Rotaria sordida TaxID=392033 RepID=A0A814SCE2_9BILA|nr:unnamed protein product [Rotaria sordida]CAF1145338.1 unnamed protein product [Rotaria sordida]